MKHFWGLSTLATILIIVLSSCSGDDKIINVESVSLNKTILNLVEEESETLTASIIPNDAENKECRWISSNSEIATVNNTGLVTAIKKGEAIISIITLDGNKSASCKVIVEAKYIPVSTLKLSETSVNIHKGENKQLTATISPNDATNKNIIWSSSDESIAKVDANGRITAIEIGNTTITASIENEKIKSTCDVFVEAISVEGICLSAKTIMLMEDDQEQLSYEITPNNADDKSVTWTIDDPSIANIDENGIITAIKRGETIITIKTNDGGYTDQCAIKVTDITDLVTGNVGKVGDVIINGVVFPSNELVVELINNSNKIIIALSIQVINDDTKEKGNIMDLGSIEVGEKQSIWYVISLGKTINNPLVRWKYRYNDSEYTLDCT